VHDALLYAVRDNLWKAGFGYSQATLDLMDGPEPPPRCGEIFVSVHQAPLQTGAETDNKLDELYGFTLSLTQRINIAQDRIGNELIAVNLRKVGFNRRCEQLRSFCHMAWGIIQDANNYLVAWAPENQGHVYGFCEPARYRGMSQPRVVGYEWFQAAPPKEGRVNPKDFGVTADLIFLDARRFQAFTEFV
jgi:hypothetical protein